MKNLKANIYTTPITMGVGMIAVIVFLVTKLPWSYYLIGLSTGLLTHGLFIKFNRMIARNLEKDPECKIYNPRNTMLLGMVLRALVVILVIVSVIFKTDLPNNDKGLWDVLFTVFGYLTYRIVFVICLVIYKDKELVISE